MKLLINGKEQELEFSSSATLTSLLETLTILGDRVAVELNGDIVSRSQWQETQLKEGDKLEIVHFVGGGRP